jgi:hypothetical protein
MAEPAQIQEGVAEKIRAYLKENPEKVSRRSRCIF